MMKNLTYIIIAISALIFLNSCDEDEPPILEPPVLSFQLTSDTTSYYFGESFFGDPAIETTFFIKESGGESNAEITEIQIEGTDADAFTLKAGEDGNADGLKGAIEKSTRKMFEISFQPPATVVPIPDDTLRATLICTEKSGIKIELVLKAVVKERPEINTFFQGATSDDPIPSYDFGLSAIDATLKRKNFYISNGGENDIEITAVELEGARDAGAFTVRAGDAQDIDGLKGVIMAGTRKTFEISFQPPPTAIPDITAKLVCTLKSGVKIELNLMARTEEIPNIFFQGSTSEDAIPSYDFGLSALGAVPKITTFHIRNNSESDIGITAVQLEGTNAGAFTVRAGDAQDINGLEGVIALDTRKMFEISFLPPATAIPDINAKLVCTMESGLQIELTLMARTEEIPDIFFQGPTSEDPITSYDFGTFVPGAALTRTIFHIKNSSESEGEITAVQLEGTNTGAFTVRVGDAQDINGLKGVIMMGTRKMFEISFQPPPMAIPDITATLVCTTRSGTMIRLDLMARTEEIPNIFFQGPTSEDPILSYDFGASVSGTAPTRTTFHIRNSSESEGEITAVQLEGTNAGAFSVRVGDAGDINGLKGVITANTRKMFEISFQPPPMAIPVITATLVCTTRSGTMIRLDLMARTEEIPNIFFQGPTSEDPITSYDFGTSVSGTALTRTTFHIKNSSESEGEITAVQLEGTNAGAFTVRVGDAQDINGLKGVIMMGTRKMFEISFQPPPMAIPAITATLVCTTRSGTMIRLDLMARTEEITNIFFQGPTSGNPITSHDFGLSPTNATLKRKNFYISNGGESDIEITAVELESARDVGAFTVRVGDAQDINGLKGVIMADTRKMFEISFQPPATEIPDITATLVCTTRSGTTIRLDLMARTEEISVTSIFFQGLTSENPILSHDFGLSAPNTNFKKINFYIKNGSESDAEITAVQLEGTNAGAFRVKAGDDQDINGLKGVNHGGYTENV